MAGHAPYLIISDLQIPFEHEKALSFCEYVKRHYRVPEDRVYNVGDEIDAYWGGLWDKDPDATLTANQEIQASIAKLEEWYRVFPEMRLCDSNHGSRWKRKAFAAQIPSQMMRLYQEVIRSPETWRWQKAWTIKEKHPFRIEHGDDWGGQYPHVAASFHNGCSTAIGHHHSIAGIEHVKTSGLRVWGMVTGCLIDFEAYAFEYARNAKRKPLNGLGLVFEQGRTPLWLPME